MADWLPPRNSGCQRGWSPVQMEAYLLQIHIMVESERSVRMGLSRLWLELDLGISPETVYLPCRLGSARLPWNWIAMETCTLLMALIPGFSKLVRTEFLLQLPEQVMKRPEEMGEKLTWPESSPMTFIWPMMGRMRQSTLSIVTIMVLSTSRRSEK